MTPTYCLSSLRAQTHDEANGRIAHDLGSCRRDGVADEALHTAA
jgi:hypothetical protein